jgi:hypothetical protein
MDYKLLLIIIIIVIICCCTTGSDNEGFDARISDISVSDCGDLCTKTYGCAGFAYDNANKKCYLSKNPILGRPGNSIYTGEYNSSFTRCNKRGKLDEGDVEDEETRLTNALYMCADGEGSTYDPKLVVNGAYQEIPENMTVQIDPYNLHSIEWPEQKRDIEVKYSEAAETKGTVDKGEAKKNQYLISPNEHLGQYLYSHQCVANTPLFDCLKACDFNSECEGCEWNPRIIQKDDNGKYTMYENVCCPKKQIAQVIDRRERFSNGKFYAKLNDELQKELDNREKITLIK